MLRQTGLRVKPSSNWPPCAHASYATIKSEISTTTPITIAQSPGLNGRSVFCDGVCDGPWAGRAAGRARHLEAARVRAARVAHRHVVPYALLRLHPRPWTRLSTCRRHWRDD
eukprot:7391077-Prymnesium_polylepis.1